MLKFAKINSNQKTNPTLLFFSMGPDTRCMIYAEAFAEKLQNRFFIVEPNNVINELQHFESYCGKSSFPPHQAFAKEMKKVSDSLLVEKDLFPDKPHLRTIGIANFMRMQTALEEHMRIKVDPSLETINLWQKL
jgi:hypothetical protein